MTKQHQIAGELMEMQKLKENLKQIIKSWRLITKETDKFVYELVQIMADEIDNAIKEEKT